MGAALAEADTTPSPETPHLIVIGKALKRLKEQFEEAYLDDHKLIVDDGKYDESYLDGLSASERFKLELQRGEDQRPKKPKRKDDSDKPWSAKFQQRQKNRARHKQMAAAFELTGDPEQDMIVDPSEFPRIMDVVHSKMILDQAFAAYMQAFNEDTPAARNERLKEMLGHLDRLDESLGYTKTDPDTGEKVMKGPLVEYKMDGVVIAKALSEIGTVLNDHLGVKNQLANDLRDDPLLGQFLR